MRPLPRISDLALGLALAALAGCSSSNPLERYPRGPFVGNQGNASEAVFAPAESRLAAGWEYARLDDSMNIRTASEADNPNPPDLSQLRRYYLTPRADQIIYFDQRQYQGQPPYRRRW